MERSPVNLDVALQYRGTAFPLAEATARGRADFLTRAPSCPYTDPQLRSAWMTAFLQEKRDFAEATARRVR